MAKFCTKCGKKLEEGKKCTCEKIKKETKIFENTKEMYEKSDIIKIIENFLSKPIDTLSNLKNYHFNSYILLIITSIVAGLFSIMFNFRLFGLNVVASSIMTFISLIILSFTTYMFYNSDEKIVFKDMLEITSVCSITLMAGFVIAFIFAFLSMSISITITFLTMLLFIINLYHGILINIDCDENKIGYRFIASVLSSGFLLMLLISIL